MRGFILSVEMLFVLPLIAFTGLVVVQFIQISIAQQRVDAAATAAARVAANGGTYSQIQLEAAGVLLYLGGESEVEIEYIDANSNSTLDKLTDAVVVGVRVPMGLVSINYIGLFGTTVNNLHIRSVVERAMLVDQPIPSGGSCPP